MPFYTVGPTMIQKWLSLVHIYPSSLLFQKLKNNGNIYTYCKARDHVVVLAMPESCHVLASAFVPLLKLTLDDFLFAL